MLGEYLDNSPGGPPVLIENSGGKLYIVINDIHLSDKAPSSCTDSYNDDLFDLLTEAGKLAARLGAAAIILAGDIFHLKTPSRTSHATVMRFIDLLRSWGIPVLIVPGNHDMSHDRADSIDETQPLGVVFASGAAHRLDKWSAVDAGIVTDPVYGMPWLSTWDDDTVTGQLADYRSRISSGGLVVAHAPFYPPGLELPYEFYPTTSVAAAMGGHGVCHYGHVHEAHGVYTAGGVTFSNPGALSRGSLHEHNLTRAVSVAAIWPASGEIKHIELPHKPAEQVFRLAEIAGQKTRAAGLDSFLHMIGTSSIEITSIEAVKTHIRDLGLSPQLTALAVELLDAV